MLHNSSYLSGLLYRVLESLGPTIQSAVSIKKECEVITMIRVDGVFWRSGRTAVVAAAARLTVSICSHDLPRRDHLPLPPKPPSHLPLTTPRWPSAARAHSHRRYLVLHLTGPLRASPTQKKLLLLLPAAAACYSFSHFRKDQPLFFFICNQEPSNHEYISAYV